MDNSKPHGKVRVTRPYQIQYPDPLRVAAGDRVSVGNQQREFPGWKWCKAVDGRAGWVPVELLLDDSADASATTGSAAAATAAVSTAPEAILLRDYSAAELAVQPGEEVMIEDARHGWLLVRNARGEGGWIPQSHISSP